MFACELNNLSGWEGGLAPALSMTTEKCANDKWKVGRAAFTRLNAEDRTRKNPPRSPLRDGFFVSRLLTL